MSRVNPLSPREVALTSISSYAMIGICPCLYVGWKILKRSRICPAAEVDLVKNLDEVAEYERSYVPSPPK